MGVAFMSKLNFCLIYFMTEMLTNDTLFSLQYIGHLSLHTRCV
jgi:hypothetical protein